MEAFTNLELIDLMAATRRAQHDFAGNAPMEARFAALYQKLEAEAKRRGL